MQLGDLASFSISCVKKNRPFEGVGGGKVGRGGGRGGVGG